ncbi:MAG: uracil-DNA glycosylase [Anaerolineae bacterium]
MTASLSEVDLTEVHRRVEVCTKCDLWRSRTRAVPGAGDPEARLMFVGEAPGYHEDRQGLPFVGAAGQLLDKLLERIGMDRSDVFITNIIKCRPPANRDPQPIEIESCHPYLDRQVELINPTVIATLGRFSMAHFIGPSATISRIHGQVHHYQGRIVLPLFHPAAALRQERFRTALEADFLLLPDLLRSDEAKPVEDDPADPPSQLTLF